MSERPTTMPTLTTPLLLLCLASATPATTSAAAPDADPSAAAGDTPASDTAAHAPVSDTEEAAPAPEKKKKKKKKKESLRRGSISQILVRGHRKVEHDAVMANIRSQPGELPDARKLRSDLRRVYEMGLFADVKLFHLDREDGTVALVFEVVEKPAVRAVLYEGNDKISTEDIEEVVDVKPFQVLDVPKLRRNVEKIQNLYVEKGYYLADVRYELREVSPEDRLEKVKIGPRTMFGGRRDGDRDGPDKRKPKDKIAPEDLPGEQVDIAFIVTENAKVLIERLALVGNRALKDADIKPFLATSEGTLISFVTDWGTYKEEEFATDLMRIEALYHDHGYINVRVDKPRVRLSADKTRMFISIPIEEGEQYTLGAKDISGDLIEEHDELMKVITIEEGALFKRSQIALDIDALANKYKDVGYAYVNITPVTKIDEAAHTVDLILEVEQGPLVTVERIEVHGNDKTRDKVIRRELRIYEGALYTATGLRESERRVNALGYFERVDVSTHRGTEPDRIVVSVHVKEKSTGTFQVSFGFSSYENFVGQMQVVQDNFLGYGWRVSLTGQISERRRIFDFQFLEPYFLDSRWTLAFNVFNSEHDFFDFRRAATGGDVTLGYPMDFGIRYLDNVYLYLTYFIERVEIPEETFNVILAGLETNKPRLTSSIRGTATYDSRDNRLFPTDGYYAMLRAEVASPYLLSENVFNRYTAIGRAYWPVAWGIVFKTNLRLGFMDSPDRIPVFESYREGGYGSIRGYYTRSLGPVERVGSTDPSSGLVHFNVGGNKDLVGNVELEFPIIEKVGIRGVIFFDLANAYAADENFFYLNQRPDPALANEPFDPVRDLPLGMYYSAGFGVRWFSPIGPLRFEWGFPLPQTRRPPGTRGIPQGDELFLFEFNIGNSF